MTSKLPPIWLMGLTNLPFGVFGAITLITTPQLLAASHVPEPIIASVTAVAMIPTFLSFLLSPVLDLKFSRRSYAIALGILASLVAAAAMTSLDHPARLGALLCGGFVSATLYTMAMGGWLGSIVGDEGAGKLGAWFTIGNIGGFGTAAILDILLYRALPPPWGALAIGLLVAAPLLLLAIIPAASREQGQARESFSTLFADIGRLVRRRLVLQTLLIFCMPCASFALTNTLGGIGGDFHASENFVAVLAGTGVTLAGIVGSLLVPSLARRVPPTLLYIGIGVVGGVFTLLLLPLARIPTTFAIALIGENLLQAAAFSSASAIIFEGIGPDNPLASTQYGLLSAAYALPVVYMQAIDGAAYGRGGLVGTLATDGLITVAAALILLPIAIRWGGRMSRGAGAATAPLLAD